MAGPTCAFTAGMLRGFQHVFHLKPKIEFMENCSRFVHHSGQWPAYPQKVQPLTRQPKVFQKTDEQFRMITASVGTGLILKTFESLMPLVSLT